MSGIFGGGSRSGSNSGLSQTALTDIAEGQVGLGNIDITSATTQGQLAGSIYDPAYQQYLTGLQGNLTDAQKSLVQQNLGTEQVGTMGTYGNLGLGGSTMEGQDLASNELKSTAEQANIANQNETLGLSGLQTANQYYSTENNLLNSAAGAYGGASSSSTSLGGLSQAETNSLNNSISSLGNKSSSGSGLASLFNSSAGGVTGAGAGVGSGLADLSGGALTTGIY